MLSKTFIFRLYLLYVALLETKINDFAKQGKNFLQYEYSNQQ